MKFLTRLWAPKTGDIVKRLMDIGEELAIAQESINKLAGTTDAYIQEDENDHRARMIHSAVGDYGVAMWAKDLDSHFIYVNKVCCSMILKCTPEEALAVSNNVLSGNALAGICMRGDREVVKKAKTLRYLEHGIYDEGHIVLDTIKSPFYGKLHKIVGTLGSCRDVTAGIPDDVLQKLDPCSVIVPTAAVLGKKDLIKYLEDCK